MTLDDQRARCAWVTDDPLYIRYHDEEWGLPLHDDRRLFELLILEGAQAGLSWLTILKKREHYRRAFSGFDPQQVARFGQRQLRRLLADPGVVRNRLKLEATIANARAVLAVQQEAGSFDAFIWSFTGGRPIRNRWKNPRDVPTRSAAAEAMSRTLTERGFRFVGPTICYAFMQAVGMVNDHLVSCFRHDALG